MAVEGKILKFVLKETAKGFLKEAGSSLFKQLFSSDKGITSEELQRVLRAELDRFASDLKAFVEQALADQALNLAVGELTDAERSFELYLESPETSLDLLDEVTSKATTAVDSVFSIGEAAVQHYAHAVHVLIGVYQQRAQIYGDDAHNVVRNVIIPRGIRELRKLERDLQATTRDRVRYRSEYVPDWSSGQWEALKETIHIDGKEVASKITRFYHFDGPGGDIPPTPVLKSRYDEEVHRLLRALDEELDWLPEVIDAWRRAYEPRERILFMLERL